jgi:hypothetical protein
MDSIANPGTAHLDMPRARFRPSAAVSMSIHRYLPVAVIYFFFNNAGLPTGLFYSTLLSPFLFLWLYLKGQRWVTAKFLLCLSPFILAHMTMGIASPFYYLRSLCLLWTAYVTVYAFCWALKKCGSVDRLFEQLILLNFCAAILSLAIFPTPLRPILWMTDDSIVGTSGRVRLALLSLEPSAYAELMLPLLIFATLRLFRHSSTRNLLYLIMIGVPFLLCQSFGGISMGLAGIGISLMIGYRRVLGRPKSLILFLCLAIATSVLLLTHNQISERVVQVLTGGDSSTKSRTTLSFLLAYVIASGKSLWWGAGLGQGKLVDVSGVVPGFSVGIIPNAVAGTFAELGIVGVLVRFAVEFYLFFRTRAYLNSFRLAAFVVAFINQLTGSYVPDVQQYLLWFFAFYPLFPEFNLRSDSKSEASSS